MRRGIWLLDRYKSEAEIDAARDRELAALHTRLTAARKRVEELKRERKKLDDEAEFHRKGLPADLKGALGANDFKVQAQERLIANTLAEMDRVNERFDSDVKFYRELTRPRKPPSPPAKN